MPRTKCVALLIIVALISCITFYAHDLSRGAVTTAHHNGLNGDQLWHYMRAKWIAHQLHLPFLYRPFKGAEQYILHNKECHLSSVNADHLSPTRVTVNSNTASNSTRGAPKLYVVEYCPKGYDYHQSDEFRNEMRERIHPVRPLETVSIPPNVVSIALHVRKGLSTDKVWMVNIINGKRTNRHWMIDALPTKFPPNEFYITALKHVVELLGPETPLYIRLFTDHDNPDEVAAMFKDNIDHPNVTFSWRDPKKSYDQCDSQEFFSLTKFDCLIRPWSNFSRIPELLGNFAIVAKLDEADGLRRKQNPQFELTVSPTHALWKKIKKTPTPPYTTSVMWQQHEVSNLTPESDNA